jgi:hypothetical protein
LLRVLPNDTAARMVGAAPMTPEETYRATDAIARDAVKAGVCPFDPQAAHDGAKDAFCIAVPLICDTARTVWALLAKGGIYQAPVAAA